MQTVVANNTESVETVASNTESVETVPKSQVIYRCKKCRRIVASDENIVPHERGKGEECFKWKKRSHMDGEAPECSSIFVESMKWMQSGNCKFFGCYLLFFHLYMHFKNIDLGFIF